MARFGTVMNRTLSTTLDVGSVINAASSMRRFQIYDLMFGSDATPGDTALLWSVGRQSAAATGGTAPAINTLDAGDVLAATVVPNQSPTTNGTHVATSTLLSVPLNQRATFRWVAAPGSELVSPVTASNGFYINALTGAIAVEATVFLEER
jgi:hypothetical protein